MNKRKKLMFGALLVGMALTCGTAWGQDKNSGLYTQKVDYKSPYKDGTSGYVLHLNKFGKSISGNVFTVSVDEPKTWSCEEQGWTSIHAADNDYLGTWKIYVSMTEEQSKKYEVKAVRFYYTRGQKPPISLVGEPKINKHKRSVMAEPTASDGTTLKKRSERVENNAYVRTSEWTPKDHLARNVMVSFFNYDRVSRVEVIAVPRSNPSEVVFQVQYKDLLNSGGKVEVDYNKTLSLNTSGYIDDLAVSSGRGEIATAELNKTTRQLVIKGKDRGTTDIVVRRVNSVNLKTGKAKEEELARIPVTVYKQPYIWLERRKTHRHGLIGAQNAWNPKNTELDLSDYVSAYVLDTEVGLRPQPARSTDPRGTTLMVKRYWSSDNPKVMTVERYGVYKPVGPGSTTLRVRIERDDTQGLLAAERTHPVTVTDKNGVSRPSTDRSTNLRLENDMKELNVHVWHTRTIHYYGNLDHYDTNSEFIKMPLTISINKTNKTITFHDTRDTNSDQKEYSGGVVTFYQSKDENGPKVQLKIKQTVLSDEKIATR
ncbi:MAG: hypothetical protein IJ659_02605 [Alloprevotella sp.]|nr:hypothetical protein [Alloprevotella sp.]